MITIERKKLEQALHELEGIPVYKKYGVRISNAITAIKEALAQPAQEPVAWLYQCTEDNSTVVLQRRTNWAESGTGLWIETPYYTTPPAAQPAPVQELVCVCGAVWQGQELVETPAAQPAQEPVAQWQKRHHLWTEGAWENSEEHDAKQWRDKAQGWEIRALYTTPQPQEPRNFCSRCGKRTADLTVIHTCTPPEGGHQ